MRARVFRMKKKARMMVAIALVVVLIFLLLWATAKRNEDALTQGEPGTKTLPVVILDPGHGGEDGGAVASDGSLEKDINLNIALQMRDILQAMGVSVIMTRETDVAIYDAGTEGLRQKKVSDIHNRTALLNETENAVLLSIHQNKYPQASVWGTQVFYSQNTDESMLIAQEIQDCVIAMLQPENHRKIKPAGTNLYLLYHAERPAVMVECGFLSNAQECAKLKNSQYQKQIAFVIACAVLPHLSA